MGGVFPQGGVGGGGCGRVKNRIARKYRIDLGRDSDDFCRLAILIVACTWERFLKSNGGYLLDPGCVRAG